MERALHRRQQRLAPGPVSAPSATKNLRRCAALVLATLTLALAERAGATVACVRDAGPFEVGATELEVALRAQRTKESAPKR